MCLNVKYVPSRSKLISTIHRERYLVPCKCGKCSECQAEIFGEWYYRIYHEWLDTLENGGYVFFDTLTYSNEYLPHLSEFIDSLYHTKADFPCFCYEDVRLFVKRLRERIAYYYPKLNRLIRVFYCAEYGTDNRFTHRPHYHILFFVRNKAVSVDFLKKHISEAWFFGRTDKVRKFGDRANYITASNGRSEKAVSNYVAKYVQKVSVFQKQIDWRLDYALKELYRQQFTRLEVVRCHHNFDAPLDGSGYHTKVDGVREIFDNDAYRSWCKSETGKKMKRDLVRLVNQFHRQSYYFGASALRDMDINEVMHSGMLTMPDNYKMSFKIPLPKYFERKLFYDQVEYNGYRCYQLTSLGLQYRQIKDARMCKFLEDKFRNLCQDYNVLDHPDFSALARYVVYYKGRVNGHILAEVRFEDKVKLPTPVRLFNYVTPTEKCLLHGAFLSSEWKDLCNDKVLPSNPYLHDSIPLSQFILSHVIDSENSGCDWICGFDSFLEKLDSLQYFRRKQKQAAFDSRQRLRNAEKHRRQLTLAI